MKKFFEQHKFLPSNLILLIICVIVILVVLTIPQRKAQSMTDQRVILIIWDGTQRNHLLELYSANQLPNLKSMVDGGGLLRTDLKINTQTCLPGSGDGYDLETGPACPAMLTGYGYPVTQNQDNRYPNPIPPGLTFFERVKQAYPDIKTGLVSNRSEEFWPLPPLQNAQPTMDYWYAAKSLRGDLQVVNHTIEFLNLYSGYPFFLVVHFVTPDNAGHAYGENSSEYTNSIIGDDTQLGLILAQVSNLGIAGDTTVLVTTDHGFGEDAKQHEACTDDNRNIWIAVNTAQVISNFAVPAYETGITPTLFDLFGMDKNTVDPAFPSQSLYLMPAPPPSPTETPTPLLTESPIPSASVTPTQTPTPTSVSFKLVFVTSATYTGNLGTLSGADQICQSLASQAGLSGTYKAWLSDSVTNISSRLTHTTAPYQRIDGVNVADNWSDLTDGSLRAPISITESGGFVSGTGVWTNSKPTGMVASTTNTCTNWGSSSGLSVRGSDTSTRGSWTSNGLLGCNYYLHLYCIQE